MEGCPFCKENALQQRADDTEEKVRHRYQVYKEQTQPLEDWYKDALIRLEADQDSEQVFSELKSYLYKELA